MKIALASDLDGTLLIENKVPKENINSLNKLKSMGGVFIIATGRPFNGVSSLIKNHNLNVDYNVLLNGALIMDKHENILIHKTIPFNIVNEILSKVEKSSPLVSLETGFKTFTLKDIHQGIPYDGKVMINSLDEISDENISLISLYFENESLDVIDNISNTINSLFSDYCISYRNLDFIDIVPIGCSKGNGINKVCSIIDLDYNNLYTIGDSFNDVSMFNLSKNSFTFDYCEEELKNYASNIVSSVSECIDNYIIK